MSRRIFGNKMSDLEKISNEFQEDNKHGYQGPYVIWLEQHLMEARMEARQNKRKCTCGKYATVYFCEDHFREAVEDAPLQHTTTARLTGHGNVNYGGMENETQKK